MSSIRITARCTKCARKFVPERDANGNLGLDDEGGLLVCDECICAECGHGHAVTEQHDTCAQDRWDDTREALGKGDSDGPLYDDAVIIGKV